MPNLESEIGFALAGYVGRAQDAGLPPRRYSFLPGLVETKHLYLRTMRLAETGLGEAKPRSNLVAQIISGA